MEKELLVKNFVVNYCMYVMLMKFIILGRINNILNTTQDTLNNTMVCLCSKISLPACLVMRLDMSDAKHSKY